MIKLHIAVCYMILNVFSFDFHSQSYFQEISAQNSTFVNIFPIDFSPEYSKIDFQFVKSVV